MSLRIHTSALLLTLALVAGMVSAAAHAATATVFRAVT
jgi:hypothetical protein